MNSIIFAYGRMNPPSYAHGLLIDKLILSGKLLNATPRLYLSQTQDVKNILTAEEKLKYLKSVYPDLDIRINTNNPYDTTFQIVMEEILFGGPIIVMKGTRDFSKYEDLLKHIQPVYPVTVHDARLIEEKNNSKYGIEGVSSSKAREIIKAGESFENVKSILLKGLSDEHINEIITIIKTRTKAI